MNIYKLGNTIHFTIKTGEQPPLQIDICIEYLPERFKWIAVDLDGMVVAYTKKPKLMGYQWMVNLNLPVNNIFVLAMVHMNADNYSELLIELDK